MSNTIEAEIVQPDNSMALAVRQAQPVGLFGTNEPAAVVEKATGVANALKDVIVKQGLVSKISGKEYPRCEAWTLLGTMLGVFPVTVWTKQIDDGWEARVEARTKDGAIIGAAEAQCLRSERNWSNRDDFALRSMAQTRATAKCLRMPLGFVMTLAGFEATPAEEMVTDNPRRPPETSADRFSKAAHSGPGRAGASDPSRNPRKQEKPPITQSVKPATAKKEPLPFADEQTRAKMIRVLDPMLDLATEYFRTLEKPTVLLPNETLEDVPLQWVPITTMQMWQLEQKIKGFGNGEVAEHPYPPNPRPESAPQAQPPAAKTGESKPKPHIEQTKAKDPEWWRDVICPVPPKGMKRDQYMKAPQTVGWMYDNRHDSEVNRRLFGFVMNFTVNKTWVNGAGQTVMRAQTQVDADTLFREALDACKDYADKHAGDTEDHVAKEEGHSALSELQVEADPTLEDDCPF